MKTTICLFAVLVLGFFFAAQNLQAAARPPAQTQPVVFQEGAFAGLTPEEVLTTPYKELKARTGKKLPLFQRMALKMAQRKYARAAKKASDKPAKKHAGNTFGMIGLILGIAGLLVVVIFGPLAILLSIAAGVLGIIGLKKDSNKGLAIAATVLGALGLFWLLYAYASFAFFYYLFS